jgi:hypothetical protein
MRDADDAFEFMVERILLLSLELSLVATAVTLSIATISSRIYSYAIRR